MPPKSKRKHGGGISPNKRDLRGKPRPTFQTAIVKPETRRNNARRTFADGQHQGFVACEGECWHEVTETESTFHNAFLSLKVLRIEELHLPELLSCATASSNTGRQVGFGPDNLEGDVGGNHAGINHAGETLPSTALPETPHHTGFLTLHISGQHQEPSRIVTSAELLTKPELENCLSTRSSPQSEQSLKRIEQPSALGAQFAAGLDSNRPSSLKAKQSRLQAKTSLILANENDDGYERYSASDQTPVTPAFCLITPTPCSARGTFAVDTGTCNFDQSSLHGANTPHAVANMAPMRDPVSVQQSMKEVIQILYDMQSQVHGFVPETQSHLIGKVSELAKSLSHLQTLTSKEESPNNPIHDIRIAPEFIDYVDDGRNPDIYTRDFVELVQRGNSVINGKQKAFRDFSEVYAKALKDGFSGMEKEVDQVMANAGLDAGQKERPNGNRAS